MTVSLNASMDGLRLSAAEPPSAELLAEIRAAKPDLLEALKGMRKAQTRTQRPFPDWSAIGSQHDHCGSCVRWEPSPTWGVFMGLCQAPADAFWPEAVPLAIHAGHRCIAKNGYAAR